MTEIIAWLLLAIACGIAAFLLGQLNSAKSRLRELEDWEQRAITAENQLASAQALLQRTETELGQTKTVDEALQKRLNELGAVEAVAREKLVQAQEEEKRLKSDREEMRQKFENLANQIFEQREARAQTSIQQALEPFKQQLEAFRTRIDEIHTAETNQGGELRTELRQLQTLNIQLRNEAENFVRALKNEPQTRGLWGELILERTMEIAGLNKDEHYRMQVTEGSARMDAVVYLPGDRCVIVDSKVPLNDYAAFCDALTDADRDRCLKALVAAVRGFIDSLFNKNYSELLGGKSPDFTIMLIPVEPAFAAAFKADGSLMDYALTRRVIPTSTASLVATLRVIENMWKIDSQNKNVQAIAAEGAKLLSYIELFVEELNGVGEALEKAQEIHGKAVRRITTGGQGSILGTSERLRNLGVRMVSGRTRRRGRAVSPETALADENAPSDASGEPNTGAAAASLEEEYESEDEQPS